jgi:hypothetical protein
VYDNCDIYLISIEISCIFPMVSIVSGQSMQYKNILSAGCLSPGRMGFLSATTKPCWTIVQSPTHNRPKRNMYFFANTNQFGSGHISFTKKTKHRKTEHMLQDKRTDKARTISRHLPLLQRISRGETHNGFRLQNSNKLQPPKSPRNRVRRDLSSPLG